MTRRAKIRTAVHARNSVGGAPMDFLRFRTKKRPRTIRKLKIFAGYDWRSTMKLNASPVGGAMMTMVVNNHLRR